MGADGVIDDSLLALIELLSARERQTLSLLLKGFSEKRIAERLGLSKQTVHVYVKNLYRTFRVTDKGQLLAQFIPAEVPAYVEETTYRRRGPAPVGGGAVT